MWRGLLCAGGGAAVAWGVRSSAVSAREKHSVRIASYNILAPNYCTQPDFCHCSVSDCDPQLRLGRVLSKLQGAVDDGAAVLCLQEVSHKWAGALHVWCAQRGYHFVYQGYSRDASDYMGCAIAWDTKVLDAHEVDIVRVSDTKPTPWPEKEKQKKEAPSLFQVVRNHFMGAPVVDRSRDFDPWARARAVHNRVMLAKLSPKGLGADSSFAVATYHMPCLFGSDPKVQAVNIHAALLQQRAQAFAAGRPLVITGDFNFKPWDSPYALMTSGKLAPTHPQAPQVAPGDSWKPVTVPMRSAYVVKNAREPSFTNHAWRSPGGDPFTETLDFMFLSPEWEVDSVLAQPDKPSVPSYPSADEPSDHRMIAASLTYC